VCQSAHFFRSLLRITKGGPGDLVKFDPGALAGAAIDPDTGAFTWDVPATLPPTLSASETFTFTVRDVAPAVTLGSSVSAVLGAKFQRVGSIASPVLGVFRATVDYGGGSGVKPLSLTPSHGFSLSHA
jgi:hypothetical protein